jgi:hypothetical protein
LNELEDALARLARKYPLMTIARSDGMWHVSVFWEMHERTETHPELLKAVQRQLVR